MVSSFVQDGGSYHFVNGSILTKARHGRDGQATFAESLFVQDGVIKAIGSNDEVLKAYQHVEATTIDLKQKTVIPSFIDGHMHLLLTGQLIHQVSLAGCQSLEELRDTLSRYAKANPDVPRILARGWMQILTPNGVDTSMLDDIDPRPLYVNAIDLHSMWCSSSALAELGVTADTPEPAGGEIHRDNQGNPSGLLSEGAIVSITWSYLASVATDEDSKNYMISALEAYSASGYTGMIEMAMDERAWDILARLYEERPDLPMRIAAYWLIRPAEDEAARVSQVERAIELSRRFNIRSTPKLRIVGIKVVIDGVTESCTAYLSEPYANSQLPQPIWSGEELEPVVKKAVAGGLQIAFHAIGDAAVSLAIRSLELSSKPGGRHRIEHLEITSPGDAKKLARLGITASFQPIHADPYLLQHWPRLLDTKRAARCYAWREFADAGALIALGTDSPVTHWNPLNNLHVATTRRSVQDALMHPVNEHFRLGLCEAVVGATAGSAKSVFADHLTGSLELGKSADLVILDMEWDDESLLKAEIQETWFEGRRIWCKDSDTVHGRWDCRIVEIGGRLGLSGAS